MGPGGGVVELAVEGRNAMRVEVCQSSQLHVTSQRTLAFCERAVRKA